MTLKPTDDNTNSDPDYDWGHAAPHESKLVAIERGEGYDHEDWNESASTAYASPTNDMTDDDGSDSSWEIDPEARKFLDDARPKRVPTSTRQRKRRGFPHKLLNDRSEKRCAMASSRGT